MAKTVNVLKGEGYEQATSSNKYPKKNYARATRGDRHGGCRHR